MSTFSNWPLASERWMSGLPLKGKNLHEKLRSAHMLMMLEIDKGNRQAIDLGRQMAEDDVLNAAIDSEVVWDCWKRPYYKIFSGMCECMEHCSIDIPTESLKMPYPVIEIRLPTTLLPKPLASSLMISCSTREQLMQALEVRFGEGDVDQAMADRHGIENAKRVLEAVRNGHMERIRKTEEENGRMVFSLQMLFRTENDRRKHLVSRNSFDAFEGQTIQQSIKLWEKRCPAEWADGISDADFMRLMRIVVATIFFAVEKHEVVTPDTDKPVETPKSNRQKALAEKRLGKCRGWRVGAEIQLPRPLIKRSDSDPSGRELHHGHVRSGHMRMQPHGPENKLRKLIFLQPTVVRPDLPMQTKQRAYVIGE